MLLHRRHASLSRAKSALARWPSLSEARNARAASVMGAVETPVFWIGKRSGTGLPSSVIPLNGVGSFVYSRAPAPRAARTGGSTSRATRAMKPRSGSSGAAGFGTGCRHT